MATRRLPDEFLALARAQHGVIAKQQLTQLGIHPSASRRRLRDGTWSDRGRAVIVCSMVTQGDDHTAWLLQMESGLDAIVSGPLAARLGGWFIPGDERVIVRSSFTKKLPEDIQILRREVPAPPVDRGLLRLAGRLDALADTLVIRPWSDACDLLDHSLQQQWIDQSIFDALIARRSGRGRTGVGRLRRLRLHVTGHHRSEAERRMNAILSTSETGEWIPNYLVENSGRIIAELDFAHLAYKIAIEVDGRAFHSDAAAFERDRIRQNRLITEGWLVLRFTWKHITEDSLGVRRIVREAVHLRGKEAS